VKQGAVRDAIRLLSVAAGIVCAGVAGIIAAGFLFYRTEPGVVRFGSRIDRGVETNFPYVVWGQSNHRGGIATHPEADDWTSPPKEGDSVTVLIGPWSPPKSAMLNSSHALWKVCRWAVGFGAVGIILIVNGLFIVRPIYPTANGDIYR
jgi:hypothetical protein